MRGWGGLEQNFYFSIFVAYTRATNRNPAHISENTLLEDSKMTEPQAAAYIAQLTYDEKLTLFEMLKSLEQNRQPDATRPGLTGQAV